MVITSPRASIRQAPVAPVDWHDEAEHRRMLAQAANDISIGNMNNKGTVTLTASTTTTTITDQRIHPGSNILLTPTTASAGGEVGWYFSSIGDGQAIITHGSSIQTDRTFKYSIT